MTYIFALWALLGSNQRPLPCKGCSEVLLNVPVKRQMSRRAGETSWRQLPLVINVAPSFTASDGLETAWRHLPREGLCSLASGSGRLRSASGQETVRSIVMPLEVRRVPTGIAPPMLREKHTIGVMRPARTCDPHISGTKPDGQPPLTDCATDVLDEHAHFVKGYVTAAV
jgi:hypothetical protein